MACSEAVRTGLEQTECGAVHVYSERTISKRRSYLFTYFLTYRRLITYSQLISNLLLIPNLLRTYHLFSTYRELITYCLAKSNQVTDRSNV